MKKVLIHRALAELKVLDAKIEKKLAESRFVDINQKGKKVSSYKTEEEFKDDAKSAWDSIRALIENKTKIKSAIVKSNSSTEISVGGVKMTVADAITYKTNISLDEKLHNTIVNQFNTASNSLVSKNKMVLDNAQKILEVTYGKDNVKVDQTQYDSAIKPFVENNEWHLVDPLKLEDKINRLGEQIFNFKTEIDAALSESNAVTTIEIDID